MNIHRVGSATVSNLRNLSNYTTKKSPYTVGVAMCSIKPDAVDLNTALYRQSVYVMFLDPVAEVAKMSTIHGNLVMMMLTKYGDFKGHPPLEGLVSAPILRSPAVVLVAVPDHTVVV